MEYEFQRVKITPLLKEAINGIAPLLTEMLNISSDAAKGVFWLTIRDWQIKTLKHHMDLLTMTEKEHDKAHKEIFKILKERIMKLLDDPKEQEELLNDIIEKVWDLAQKYAKKLRSKKSDLK